MESLKYFIGQSVDVIGRVATCRSLKKRAFISIIDVQSTLQTQFQLICDTALMIDGIKTGAVIKATGVIEKTPVTVKSPKQQLEMKVSKLELIGACDETYPLAKQHQSLDYLRTIPHFRIRSKLFRAIMAIRDKCDESTDYYFRNDLKYTKFDAPILTTNDCEGAGEAFEVVTGSDKPFFRCDDGTEKKAYLTVSGQLHGEAYALAIGGIYTVGRTFRAEESRTTRHLADFRMVEPEIPYIDFTRLQSIAIVYVKTVIEEVLALDEHLSVLDEYHKFDILEVEFVSIKSKLHQIIKNDVKIITYSEAITLLQSDKWSDVKWGDDLSSEQEKWIVKYYDTIIIVTHYPRDLKSFYMKLSPDVFGPDGQKTVEAMDMLVPGIGELIGGSMREDDYEELKAQMDRKGIEQAPLKWYLDLRKYGSIPHGGFGLGFERLIMLCTDMKNIKDVVPFPTWHTHIF